VRRWNLRGSQAAIATAAIVLFERLKFKWPKICWDQIEKESGRELDPPRPLVYKASFEHPPRIVNIR
jgi:hypothetical protein